MQPNNPQQPDPNNPQAYPPQNPQYPPGYNQPTAPNGQQPYNYPTGPQHEHLPDYDFIMNPQKNTPPKKVSLPSGNSKLQRFLVIGGVCILLIVALGFVRGLLSNKADVSLFVPVAQDQQELVHISTNAYQQPALSTVNKNSAITVQLSVASAQSDTLKYMRKNGKKVSAKQLNLKVSASADSTLTEAATANRYNPAYKEVMKEKLITYQRDLTKAYASAGENGKALLHRQFLAADLLLQQLDAVPS